MKVKNYLMHLDRINKEEMVWLPPKFDDTQSLTPEEITDILLWGTPKSWQREMDRQGFDPLDKGPKATLAFMEQIEASEDFDGDKKKIIAKAEGKKGNNNKAKKNNNTSGQKYCLLHGNNNTHSTDECNTLKAQAKKLKGDGGGAKAKGKGKNKTWKNKSKTETDKSKEELASFVKKAVKQGVKQELKAIDKKRKSDSDDESMDLNAFEVELDKFNYEDMENLVIDDKGEEGRW